MRKLPTYASALSLLIAGGAVAQSQRQTQTETLMPPVTEGDSPSSTISASQRAEQRAQLSRRTAEAGNTSIPERVSEGTSIRQYTGGTFDESILAPNTSTASPTLPPVAPGAAANAASELNARRDAQGRIIDRDMESNRRLAPNTTGIGGSPNSTGSQFGTGVFGGTTIVDDPTGNFTRDAQGRAIGVPGRPSLSDQNRANRDSLSGDPFRSSQVGGPGGLNSVQTEAGRLNSMQTGSGFRGAEIGRGANGASPGVVPPGTFGTQPTDSSSDVTEDARGFTRDAQGRAIAPPGTTLSDVNRARTEALSGDPMRLDRDGDGINDIRDDNVTNDANLDVEADAQRFPNDPAGNFARDPEGRAIGTPGRERLSDINRANTEALTGDPLRLDRDRDGVNDTIDDSVTDDADRNVEGTTSDQRLSDTNRSRIEAQSGDPLRADPDSNDVNGSNDSTSSTQTQAGTAADINQSAPDGFRFPVSGPNMRNGSTAAGTTSSRTNTSGTTSNGTAASGTATSETTADGTTTSGTNTDGTTSGTTNQRNAADTGSTSDAPRSTDPRNPGNRPSVPPGLNENPANRPDVPPGQERRGETPPGETRPNFPARIPEPQIPNAPPQAPETNPNVPRVPQQPRDRNLVPGQNRGGASANQSGAANRNSSTDGRSTSREVIGAPRTGRNQFAPLPQAGATSQQQQQNLAPSRGDVQAGRTSDDHIAGQNSNTSRANRANGGNNRATQNRSGQNSPANSQPGNAQQGNRAGSQGTQRGATGGRSGAPAGAGGNAGASGNAGAGAGGNAGGGAAGGASGGAAGGAAGGGAGGGAGGK